jgi:hypothetical protein
LPLHLSFFKAKSLVLLYERVLKPESFQKIIV